MFNIVGILNDVEVTLNEGIDIDSAYYLADRYIKNGSAVKVTVYDHSLPEGENEVFKIEANKEVS